MGADSAGVNVDTFDIRIRDDSKVFAIGQDNTQMLLGFTSSFRMGQLLRFSLKVPTQPKGIDNYQYLCTYFIDSVRTCLSNGGYTRIECNQEVGGTFLLGFNGSIYTIDQDFQVGISNPNVDAVGSGSYYALGSLYTTQKIKDPQKRIKIALQAASTYNAGVRPPFRIMSL